jgi:AcrR family transcriptional regulator
MGRERRPADWAAWMESGASAAATRAPGSPEAATVTGPGGEPVIAPDRATPQEERDAPAGAEPEAAGERGRTPRREATRQRVLDAAREVFAEKGVIGGTVEDICERAGFTRGAFYSNFADKDDVVDALVESEHDLLLRHLDASFVSVEQEVSEAPDLAAVLASIVDRILRSVPVDRQMLLVQTELEIFAIRRPDLGGRFVETNNRFRERIATFLDEAMRHYGREMLVDPAMLTDSIVAITERSVRRALLAGGGADPDAMASAVLPGLLLAFSRPVTPA